MNERFKLKYPARTLFLHLGVSLFLFLFAAVGVISREFPFVLIAPFTFLLGMYLLINLVMTNIFGRLYLTLDEKELRLHIWTGDKSVEWTNIDVINSYSLDTRNKNMVGVLPLVAEPFRLTPTDILKYMTGFRYVFAIDQGMISTADFKTFIARCEEKLGADKVRGANRENG